ncbi:MAG: transcriptional regulator [Bdellovibrio sp. ArHS]|uniref:TetR/AcrR family transcriptional regulator n=1 Tax=Bdellovibrio sp. ArHS TaxID=1569284 RepID=UPI000583C79D|nr:TetR/AcrR family transcriptional regulator [Bdellovibrio sp. ArHS]KHD88235.1 MAG: transcriptional regulator [Bdellovibrio sp. ArHS]
MSETSQLKTPGDESPAQIKGKKRDRSASEERLIQAGLETFAKHGFNGATTKMIAKKADVNESLIGRYFDGKEGLLVAIIEKFLEQMTHEALPYPPQKTLSEELELYVTYRMQQGCMHEDFARIVFSQALVDRKFKKKVRETIPLTIDPKLLERVQLLIQDGRLKPGVDLTEVCEHIDSFLDGVFFFDHILHEESEEFLKKKAIRFVQVYAKLYDK